MEGTTIGVDTDEESFAILLRMLVDRKTVAGPYVDSYALAVVSNELLESSTVNLSSGSTTNQR